MRPHPRKFFLTIFSTLTVMLLCPALQANGITTTITLGGGYSYSQFTLGLVAPYSANVVGNGVNLCGVIHGTIGITGYPTQTTSVVNEEQEAAFLSSYALAQGAKPTGDNANVNTREGPISIGHLADHANPG